MRSPPDRIWSTINNTNQHEHSIHPNQLTDDHPSTESDNQLPIHSRSSEAIPARSIDPWYRQNRPAIKRDWMSGYAQMVTDRVRDGWSCYFVTFLFDQLPGSRETIMHRMKDEVQRVYSTLLTRVNRKPRTASPDELPVLIGLADLPVHKRDRSSAPRVRCNDGLHFHALVLLPPSSRLKASLVDHFLQNEGLYVGPGNPVQRIHAKPVTYDPDHVVDYTFKSVRRHRLSYEDAVLVLPRCRSELERRQ
jgi:hypothetical protein